VLLASVSAACSGGSRHSLVRQSGTTSSSSTSTSTTATTPAPPPATAAAPANCPAVPPRATPDPNRPRYTLTVNVDLPSNTVAGDLEVRFTPDMNTDRLVFRLWPNGPALAGVGAHIDVGGVTVGGATAPTSFANATTLVIPGSYAAGQPQDIAMNWQLKLPSAVNDRVARIGEAVRLGSFFPILPWESGVGWDTEPPPPQFAEASTAPTADFDVTVATNPPDLGVLASGVPDPSRPGHWTATAVRDFAMSTGRFAIATATAHVPDPVAVTVGASAGTGVDPATFAAKAVNVLQTHSARFGPYAWSTYTLAITPNLSGGIEYPTFVMQGPSTIGRTTSHELGHEWFYSLVGNDQGRDPWLDEGLATYAEGRYEGTIGGMKTASIPPGAAGHLGEPLTYWGTNRPVYNSGVYIQGAKALATLGDLNLVDCGLRIYAARNAYRIARPADLVAAMATVFPNAPQVLAGFGVHP
jgi:hypothetical protein